jgi:hypothetical protein
MKIKERDGIPTIALFSAKFPVAIPGGNVKIRNIKSNIKSGLLKV